MNSLPHYENIIGTPWGLPLFMFLPDVFWFQMGSESKDLYNYSMRNSQTMRQTKVIFFPRFCVFVILSFFSLPLHAGYLVHHTAAVVLAITQPYTFNRFHPDGGRGRLQRGLMHQQCDLLPWVCNRFNYSMFVFGHLTKAENSQRKTTLSIGRTWSVDLNLCRHHCLCVSGSRTPAEDKTLPLQLLNQAFHSRLAPTCWSSFALWSIKFPWIWNVLSFCTYNQLFDNRLCTQMKTSKVKPTIKIGPIRMDFFYQRLLFPSKWRSIHHNLSPSAIRNRHKEILLTSSKKLSSFWWMGQFDGLLVFQFLSGCCLSLFLHVCLHFVGLSFRHPAYCLLSLVADCLPRSLSLSP